MHETGQLYYEISMFYFIKLIESPESIGSSFTENNITQFLVWLPIDRLNQYSFIPIFNKRASPSIKRN